MDIWVAGTLNQLIIEVYYAQINFSKTVLWDRSFSTEKTEVFFKYKKNYFSKTCFKVKVQWNLLEWEFLC